MTSATADYAIASKMTVLLQQCVKNFVLQVQADGKKMDQREEGRKSQTAFVPEVWPWSCAEKAACRIYSCTAGLPCTGREPLRIKWSTRPKTVSLPQKLPAAMAAL